MISAAGITLGVVHLRFWISQRERRDQLAFALACISLGVFVVFEIGMLRAETPQEYGSVLTWAQIAASIHMVACAWFMKVNLDGRPSLFWLIFGLRGASTVINLFTYPESMNFTEISSLGHATVLGETLSYPIGIPNPLALIPQAGMLLLIVYAFDSCIRLWRREDRRKALVFGSASIAYAAWILIVALGSQWGMFAMPVVISPSLLLLAVPMLYELNYEMQHSIRLTGKLLEREHELAEALNWMNLSADTGNLGMWTRKAGEEELLLSKKARRSSIFRVRHEQLFQNSYRGFTPRTGDGSPQPSERSRRRAENTISSTAFCSTEPR